MIKNTNKTHKGWWVMALFALVFTGLLVGCANNSTEETGSEEDATDQTEETVSDQTDEDDDTNEEVNNQEDDGSENEEVSFEEETGTEKVTVVNVVDGNTIVVRGDDGEENVKLLLVDTPAKRAPDGSEDQFGVEAEGYVWDRLVGFDVYLEVGDPAKDDDGNTLAYIRGKHDYDESFNHEMIRAGLARLKESPDHTEYLESFKEAEAYAKEHAEEDRNIWYLDGYVTEDGFNPSILK